VAVASVVGGAAALLVGSDSLRWAPKGLLVGVRRRVVRLVWGALGRV
jgi:hypothetical protein